MIFKNFPPTFWKPELHKFFVCCTGLVHMKLHFSMQHTEHMMEKKKLINTTIRNDLLTIVVGKKETSARDQEKRLRPLSRLLLFQLALLFSQVHILIQLYCTICILYKEMILKLCQLHYLFHTSLPHSPPTPW